MSKIINIAINGYEKCKKYLENMDLIIFILVTIIFLYFLMYLISFFFKLPVIILIGLLIGYYVYNNKNKKNIKII
jgi:hypothetical protein